MRPTPFDGANAKEVEFECWAIAKNDQVVCSSAWELHDEPPIRWHQYAAKEGYRQVRVLVRVSVIGEGEK